MIEVTDKPMMTFLVLAYVQEQFIREAIEGAFAQTYSPLEIILSDDCSDDRTFSIMEEMRAAYRGPHRVLLNRNPTNQGLARHVNRGIALATGEWIIIAAGDDISQPSRTEKLISIVRPDDHSLFSNLMVMDQHGRERGLYFANGSQHSTTVEEAVHKRGVFLVGASHAIRRETHLRFSPLDRGIVQEDEVLAFRSLLAGSIAYVDEPLVRYRRHDRNTWHNTKYSWADFRSQRRREAVALQAKFRTWIEDMKCAGDLGFDTCRGTKVQSLIGGLQAYLDGPLELRAHLAGPGWWRLPGVCSRGLRILGVKVFVQQVLMAFLPHSKHLAVLRMKHRIRRVFRTVP